MNELTPRAQLADAVNTITRDGQNLIGDNTDGVGLVTDLRSNLGLRWNEPRILLLGAGGAARGVIGPLLELNPRALVIANRTADRAMQLVREFAPFGPVSGCTFDELTQEHFDLIINATSASLRGEVPAIPPERRRCAHDLLRHVLWRDRNALHGLGPSARRRALGAGLGDAGRAGGGVVRILARRPAGHGAGARGAALAAAGDALIQRRPSASSSSRANSGPLPASSCLKYTYTSRQPPVLSRMVCAQRPMSSGV